MSARNEIGVGGFIPWGHLRHSWCSKSQELMVTKDIFLFSTAFLYFILVFLITTVHPFAPERLGEPCLPWRQLTAAPTACLGWQHQLWHAHSGAGSGPQFPGAGRRLPTPVLFLLWGMSTTSASRALGITCLLQHQAPHLGNVSYFVTPNESQTPPSLTLNLILSRLEVSYKWFCKLIHSEPT